ncbi:glyoxalase family protein [Streptococcus pyogenes]|nr:glyoxalase family protein [Streptococcus pyogenes]
MTYPYNSTISLGTVSLNVTDLAKMTTFYTSIMVYRFSHKTRHLVN